MRGVCPWIRKRLGSKNTSLRVAAVYGYPGVADRTFFLDRALNGAGNDRSQFAFEQVEDVRGRAPLAEAEHSLGAPKTVEELPVFIDEEARRHVLVEQLI